MINFLFSLIIFYPEKLCQKIRCFVSVALFDILSNKLWNLCHGAAVTAGLCIVLLVSPVHLLPLSFLPHLLEVWLQQRSGPPAPHLLITCQLHNPGLPTTLGPDCSVTHGDHIVP